jgi:hypothetical protein
MTNASSQSSRRVVGIPANTKAPPQTKHREHPAIWRTMSQLIRHSQTSSAGWRSFLAQTLQTENWRAAVCIESASNGFVEFWLPVAHVEHRSIGPKALAAS